MHWGNLAHRHLMSEYYVTELLTQQESISHHDTHLHFELSNLQKDLSQRMQDLLERVIFLAERCK